MTAKFKIRMVTRADGAIARALGLTALDAEPHEAGRIELAEEATAEEAFAAVLLHCLRHVASNAPAITLSRDPEGIHQIRVGLRRLRAAMTSFGPAFRTPVLETLRAQAQILARQFGETRELDVFALTSLPAIEEAADGQRDFMALRFALEDLRNESWNDAAELAQSDMFTQFILDMAAFAQNHAWRDGAGNARQKSFAGPAHHLARKVLDERLKKARKRARLLDELTHEQRHELRIQLKKVRYAAEFFASLFADKPVAPFLKSLSGVQDRFGAFNDASQVGALLQHIVGKLPEDRATPELRESAAFAAGWQSAGMEPLWLKARKRWKGFAQLSPFWH